MTKHASRVPVRSTLALFALFSLPDLVLAQSQPADCRVVGVVVDAEFGTPIAGASVWLEAFGTEDFLAGSATSADGVFSLDARLCGTVELTVRMLGYETSVVPIAFSGSGETNQLEVQLERNPIELEELQVDVPQSTRLQETGFYARRAWEESTGEDYGQFYEPEEVARRSVAYEDAVEMSMDSRMHFIYHMHDSCSLPSFYIDGRPFRAGDNQMFEGQLQLGGPTEAEIIRDIRTVNAQERGENYRAVNLRAWMQTVAPFDDIEGMEIYRPLHGAIPDEFREPNSNLCGAVLIWTKSGGARDIDYIASELCEATPGSEGSTIGGLVVDQLSGISLPGARVTMVLERTGGYLEEVETLSDVEGRYRFCDVLALPVRLGARYTDHFGPQSAVPVIGDWEAIELSVPVVAQGTIAGKVMAADVSTLEVAITGTTLTRVPDAQGHFEFEGLPPRDYMVTVSRAGEVIEGVILTVEAEETTSVDFEVTGTP